MFHERRSNYWLVAELLASRGSLNRETAFGSTVLDAVMQTIGSAVGSKEKGRFDAADRNHPGLALEAVSLIFCAIAKNINTYSRHPWDYIEPEDQSVVDDLLRGIRSADRDVDRS